MSGELPAPQVYEIDGVVPVIDPSAFVHPTAVLIGDVVIGPDCYIGPNASLRGDMGRIRVGAGANVQDNCVVHCFPDRETVIESGGHVGHLAMLHGCHIGAGVLVGIGAIVMDGVVIGDRSFVGAHSFVPSDMQVGPGRLVVGSPAKDKRALTEAEMTWKANGTKTYQELTRRSAATMRPATALTELPDGPRQLSVSAQTAVPLRQFRAQSD